MTMSDAPKALTVVPIERPKRLNDFQSDVERMISAGEYGHLTVAETIGTLQIVILNLWNQLREES